MPRYEFSEGSSNKFWEIQLSGASFTTLYGRIGSNGQSTTKSFDTEAKAKSEYEKLIAEKVKKGYLLVNGGAATPPATASPPTAAPTPRPKPATAQPTPGAATEAKPAGAPVTQARAIYPVAAPVAAADDAPVAVPAAAPVNASVTAPIAPPVPPPPSGPVITWTEALQKKAKAERSAFTAKPRARRPANEAFATVRSEFILKSKTELEHGESKATTFRQQMREVIWQYGGSTPPARLDAKLEGAALLCVPRMLTWTEKLANIRRSAEQVVDFWVAHSGVAFAVEALVESLSPMRVTSSDYRGEDRWLASQREPNFGPFRQNRPDRALRGALLTAPPEEAAAAHARAVGLRAGASLAVRAALTSVFLDPEWIASDLAEATSTGASSFMTPEVLLAAPPELLAPFFKSYNFEHGNDDPGRFHREMESNTFALALLADRGEAAIKPLAAWLERSAVVSGELGLRFTELPYLLDALEPVTGSSEVLAGLVQVLRSLHDHALSKGEDPRPLATLRLKREPVLAAPLVREVAARGASWAKELATQLERVATPQPRGEPASTEELPPALASGKPGKLPAFWMPESFAEVQLLNGKVLPREALDRLATLLGKGDAAALAEVKAASRPESLAAFAWDLFQAWLTAGASSKEKWAFTALGTFGNDDCARKLTPLVRAWPGEAAHQRAVIGLDVLGEIGSDVALMMLHGIAQKLKFKGLQDRARLKMEEIAQKRGFTTEELADRLVPDLDLEDDGSRTLDFGPRSFRVGFDEGLRPFVMDASGKQLKDLPKPGAKDEAELANAAVEAWKTMKKDARALASLQLQRIELAMSNERFWAPVDFEAFLVHHPLLIHVVRRLVWGIYDAKTRALTGTFRVAEDRTYANAKDDALTLPDGVLIGVAHRLHLTDEDVSAWSRVFADYELIQPFEQLARKTYQLSDGGLDRFVGRKVETGKVLGLQNSGWRRGTPQDAGWVPLMFKPINATTAAILMLDPGLSIGSMEYTEKTQRIDQVVFGPGDPGWGVPQPIAPETISRVVMSEVLRDVDALGQVAEQS